VQSTPITQSYRLVEATSIGEVREDVASGQKAFFAGRFFSAGEVDIFFCGGRSSHHPILFNRAAGRHQTYYAKPGIFAIH